MLLESAVTRVGPGWEARELVVLVARASELRSRAAVHYARLQYDRAGVDPEEALRSQGVLRDAAETAGWFEPVPLEVIEQMVARAEYLERLVQGPWTPEGSREAAAQLKGPRTARLRDHEVVPRGGSWS